MQAQHYKTDIIIIDGVQINDFVDKPKGILFYVRRKINFGVKL
jgi:hypothetical protein